MEIFDFFHDFTNYYNKDLNKAELFTEWLKYISQHNLKDLCLEDYLAHGYDIDEIAMNYVFCYTHENIDKMLTAYKRLKAIIPQVMDKINEVVRLEDEIKVIIYHGLGNGAGWAIKYQGYFTVLFGLEKIAELNWHTFTRLEALVTHELMHIIHFSLRGYEDFQKKRTLYQEAVWNIYVEGFAQYYQSNIMGKRIESRDPSWFNTCFEIKDDLKKIYLKQLHDNKKGCQDFFGDWEKVLGISDVGYFLGQLFMEQITKMYSMKEIACLKEKDIEKELLSFLKEAVRK